MSKLDLTLTENVLTGLNKINNDLIDVKKRPHSNLLKPTEMELEIWREIFKEDQVKIHGCRCGCR
ncbi:hypothetical protein MN086_03715 [Sulfurovum sp. XGS-02]|uniref:hypothetical protein n=1 Tax=Sulfurovum sp. XGS-02 TaxID=2925411 RepID=UPI00205E0A94|nr:hypothetical protein [Sulfurovum sp. XGS-02]UPT78257.1 hypothetical protein MN086_03715 [Sulfurovum sp. XGS-02]